MPREHSPGSGGTGRGNFRRAHLPPVTQNKGNTYYISTQAYTSETNKQKRVDEPKPKKKEEKAKQFPRREQTRNKEIKAKPVSLPM